MVRQTTFPYTDPHEGVGPKQRRLVKVHIAVIEIKPFMFANVHRQCAMKQTRYPTVDTKKIAVTPYGKVCVLCSNYLSGK